MEGFDWAVASAVWFLDDVTLLEREWILADLHSLVASADSGEGRVALIRGDAGTGKTSVVESLIHACSGSSHILLGSCDDLLTPLPLGPIRDMASSNPSLSEALSDGASSVLQTMTELFQRKLRSTVCVFEDVHWVDEATLDLVSILARRIEQTHAVLILTFRETVQDDSLLLRLLGAMPSGSCASYELSPLSKEAVLSLAGDRQIGEQVWHLTAGNPFYVSEVLAHDLTAIPTSVKDALRSQLTRLSPQARELARLISVVPGGADIELVQLVDVSLVDYIIEAERHGVLVSDGSVLRFKHELSRAAVEASQTARGRALMHARVLQAAEQLEMDATRAAHHARQAGDFDAIVRILPSAAKQAASNASHREAVSHLEALEPHIDRVSPQSRAELYELWARENWFVSGDGLGQAMKAVALRREAGDPSALGASLLVASRSAYLTGHNRLAQEAADEAVSVLSSVGGPLLAEAYAELSRLAMLRYDFETAIEHGEEALSIASRNSIAAANALTNIGTAKAIVSYPDGADLLLESAEICAQLGLGREGLRARGNLISVAARAKDYDLAERLNDEILDDYGDHTLAVAAWSLTMKGLSKLDRGELAAAEKVLRSVSERDDLDVPDRIAANIFLAKTLVRKGAHDARETLENVTRMSAARDEPQHVNGVCAAWAEYLWLNDLSDTRRTQLCIDVIRREKALGPWDVADVALWLWLDGHIDEVPSAAALPVRQLALGAWKEAAGWFNRRGLPYEEAVALSHGTDEAGIEAVRISDSIGALPLAAMLRRRLRRAGVTGVPRGPRPATRSDGAGLTPRQREVLGLMESELTNAQIADRLFISPRTAEKHVAAVLRKLNVSSRADAASAARRLGLL